MNPRYRIVLLRPKQEGEMLRDLRSGLAALFGVDEARAGRLLEQAPVVIKAGLSERLAVRYREAVERTGAACRVEAELRPEMEAAALEQAAVAESEPVADAAPARPSDVERTGQEIKEFFNNIGVSSAVMVGFSFAAMIELQSWEPTGGGAALKGPMFVFLVISFVSFVAPLMLNMLLLNVRIETHAAVRQLRKAQLLYTLILGAGMGGLLGALALFMRAAFEPSLANVLTGILLAAVGGIAFLLRWFKTRLGRDERQR